MLWLVLNDLLICICHIRDNCQASKIDLLLISYGGAHQGFTPIIPLGLGRQCNVPVLRCYPMQFTSPCTTFVLSVHTKRFQINLLNGLFSTCFIAKHLPMYYPCIYYMHHMYVCMWGKCVHITKQIYHKNTINSTMHQPF